MGDVGGSACAALLYGTWVVAGVWQYAFAARTAARDLTSGDDAQKHDSTFRAKQEDGVLGLRHHTNVTDTNQNPRE